MRRSTRSYVPVFTDDRFLVLRGYCIEAALVQVDFPSEKVWAFFREFLLVLLRALPVLLLLRLLLQHAKSTE